jgi:hypothetical protein
MRLEPGFLSGQDLYQRERRLRRFHGSSGLGACYRLVSAGILMELLLRGSGPAEHTS